MTDDRTNPQADTPDAAIEQFVVPEQPPMDAAAGGPAGRRAGEPTTDPDDDAIEDVSTEDLSVQGGE